MNSPSSGVKVDEATDCGAVADGECSGISSRIVPLALSGRRVDLDTFRRETPYRWMCFLHSQFPNYERVRDFFSVDDRTARNWWHGKNEPRLSSFCAMLHELPPDARSFVITFMAEAA